MTRARLSILAAMLAAVLILALTVPSSAAVGSRVTIADTDATAVDVAISFSQATFADGAAGTALLAREDLFADSLASGTLQQGVPLLLNHADTLDDAVLAELRRLGVTDVVIMGGEAAISPAVETALQDQGIQTRRLAGSSRVETAIAAAAETPEATSALLLRAFESSTGDATQAFADSLAAGAWAAQDGLPILLTQTDGLTPATAAYLQSSAITEIIVVGGTSAISDQVISDLEALNITVRRVSDANRFATATAILADRTLTVADVDTVLLVEGQAGDAWTRGFPAAAYAHATDAALLLVNGDTLPDATQAWLTAGTAGDVTLVCAASASACDTAATALGGGMTGTTDLTSVWILGAGETSPVVEAGSTVNVTEVTTETVDGADYIHVVATGLPDYESTIDQEEFDFLTGRPNAATDFDDGTPTVAVGDTVTWGDDIGYVNDQCAVGAGQGYWPPGPGCPTTQAVDAYFPVTPTLAAEGEESVTGLGILGLWVNGVALFGWGDGGSFDNAGVWQNLAPVFEVYDLDVCDGHAANGEYHHHNDADCLADEIGDEGGAHSPVYGVAADGYAIYGPWVADGVLARSSWAVRGFDDADSITGCGEAGVRSCVMVDRLDPSAGTEPAGQDGPTTTENVTTMSGNVITAVAGSYFEDYYYDSSLDDGSLQALDEHNGHDHDGLGYHYHVTLEADADGHTTNVFPYFVGESFAGVLADNAVAMAGGVGAPGGGTGGPPPGGGPGGPPAAG